MNASPRRLQSAACCAALVSSIAFTGTALAAEAKTGCRTSDPMRTSLMRKADEGVDALRRYVTMTRGIHQMDMATVSESIDRWRAEAGCPGRVAAARDAATQVALKSER